MYREWVLQIADWLMDGTMCRGLYHSSKCYMCTFKLNVLGNMLSAVIDDG